MSTFTAIRRVRKNRPLTLRELDKVRDQLDAIACYARDSRELLSSADLLTDEDKAGMRQTWILQAVKTALHTLNQFEE